MVQYATGKWTLLTSQTIQLLEAFGQAYEWIEYFAGEGNVIRVMVSAGYMSARLDLMDNKQQPHRRTNFMDLSHASGFAFLGTNVIVMFSSQEVVHPMTCPKHKRNLYRSS